MRGRTSRKRCECSSAGPCCGKRGVKLLHPRLDVEKDLLENGRCLEGHRRHSGALGLLKGVGRHVAGAVKGKMGDVGKKRCFK